MTQGERDSSGGELFSFLHLTGFRPLILALLAGLAGAAGVFLALQDPAQFQARYVLNVGRVADADSTAGELDLVAEEIVSTASFPEVESAVEERTGLVFEDDYMIVINRAGGALININVVADDPTDAQNVAIETGIEAISITTERQIAGVVSSRDQLEDELLEVDSRISELNVLAGGLNPTVALDNAEAQLLARRAEDINPITAPVLQEDGTVLDEIIDSGLPAATELEAVVSALSPIAREFVTLQTEEAALNVRLADRNNSIREAESAIALIEQERENPLVISEVVTEETSRISALLTGLLTFAVPAALIVILFFTIFDLIRRKPEEKPLEGEAFDAAGELDSKSQRALPESTTRLTVVDEDESDILAEEDDGIIDVVAKEGADADADDFEDGDDEPPKNSSKKKKKDRSKDGRWGRDASSKAG